MLLRYCWGQSPHSPMSLNTLAKQIVAMYERHGWHLVRALVCEENREDLEKVFPGIPVEQAPGNALWFSRPSHGHREAWELRLLAETPYALFQTFSVEDDEEYKAGVRADMVRKMSEQMKT